MSGAGVDRPPPGIDGLAGQVSSVNTEEEGIRIRG